MRYRQLQCEDLTAYALARFIPDEDTWATRVEFWTTDATSDVDVYVYDDFNESTPSNPLASKLNNSFSEAGYHSVALDAPVPASNGDPTEGSLQLEAAEFHLHPPNLATACQTPMPAPARTASPTANTHTRLMSSRPKSS